MHFAQWLQQVDLHCTVFTACLATLWGGVAPTGLCIARPLLRLHTTHSYVTFPENRPWQDALTLAPPTVLRAVSTLMALLCHLTVMHNQCNGRGLNTGAVLTSDQSFGRQAANWISARRARVPERLGGWIP